MDKTILSTNEFWKLLKEKGVIPKTLDKVIYFSITGEPGQALQMRMIKMVTEEEGTKIAQILEEYQLELTDSKELPT